VNTKQSVFVLEYLKDFNATQAAIRAGYSKRTAYSIGQENLKKPEIAQAIKAEITERSMSSEEVITRLSEMARGDLAELMDITPAGYTFALMIRDANGNLINNPKTKLIKKIKQKTTTYLAKQEDGEDREIIETELELYSSQEALNTLAKYHGLLVDRTNITGDLGLLVKGYSSDIDPNDWDADKKQD
jgi:phage terminase small subunit